MDRYAMNIVDERLESEEENFQITDDSKAEWALGKIALEKAESQRYMNVCETMILAYKLKMEQEQERLRSKTSYFEGKLKEYFDSVEKKTTKTQATYRLPSGTLKVKYKKKIEKDEDKLEAYLKEKYPEFIEVVETKKICWGDFKKLLTFDTKNNQVKTADGEILEFIKETIEDEFVVEV